MSGWPPRKLLGFTPLSWAWLLLGCVLFLILAVVWEVAGTQARDAEGLVSRVGLWVAGFDLVPATISAAATLWYARITNQMLRMTFQQQQANRRDNVRSRLTAFTTATAAVASHGAVLAHLQKRGLLRVALQGRALEEASLRAWERLSEAVLRAVQVGDELVAQADGLDEPVESVTEVLLSINEAAAQGRPNEVLLEHVADMRRKTEQLRLAAEAITNSAH